MIAEALPQPATYRGLRPFSLFRDMRQVADLVELVFGEELAHGGEEIIAEMRRWATWAPLLWLVSPLDPVLLGFVWIEEGRVVGNVTLGLPYPESGCWLISNMAVHPHYRRRGIARHLLEAALDFIRMRGGQTAVLQVRAENEAAQQLYRSFGFTHYHTQVEMLRPADAPRQVAAPAELSWRQLRSRDRQAVRELALAATPAEIQRLNVVLGPSWRLPADPWSGWLSDFLAQRHTYRLVVEDATQAVAFLELQAQRSRHHHRLSLLVRPERRGTLERAMIQQALFLLNSYPCRNVMATISASHPEAVEALASWGFVEARRLDQMKLSVT